MTTKQLRAMRKQAAIEAAVLIAASIISLLIYAL